MGLLSNLEIFQEEHFFIIGTQKTQTKCIIGTFMKGTVWLGLFKPQVMFYFFPSMITFINNDVKVVLQSIIPASKSGGNLIIGEITQYSSTCMSNFEPHLICLL